MFHQQLLKDHQCSSATYHLSLDLQNVLVSEKLGSGYFNKEFYREEEKWYSKQISLTHLLMFFIIIMYQSSTNLQRAYFILTRFEQNSFPKLFCKATSKIVMNFLVLFLSPCCFSNFLLAGHEAITEVIRIGGKVFWTCSTQKYLQAVLGIENWSSNATRSIFLKANGITTLH